MKKNMFLLLVLVSLPNLCYAVSWQYVWGSTKYFFSTKEGYKAIEGLKITDDLINCSTAKDSDFKDLPRNSLFQIPQPTERYKLDKEIIIRVTYVAGDSPDLKLLSGLYKICLKPEKKENDRYRYKRIGGMTTGVLVVPYKWREDGNNFSGEATVGPYWGFQNEFFTLALTAGLSQVAVQEEDTKELKYETGFSYGAGFIFYINENFDIALVAGKDHLFGDIGENFQHQDDIWYSFAIGYKFGR